MDELERMARAIAAVKMGLSNKGERLPDDLWKQALPAARAAMGALETPPARPRRRDEDWHYDSQGYCDNPGRGY